MSLKKKKKKRRRKAELELLKKHRACVKIHGEIELSKTCPAGGSAASDPWLSLGGIFRDF